MRVYELINNRDFQTIINGVVVDCKKRDLFEMVFNHPKGTLFFINEENCVELDKVYRPHEIVDFMAEISILCESKWNKSSNKGL